MRPLPQQVIAMVAEAYGLVPDDLYSRSREGKVVNARAIATFLLRAQLRLSATETSELLNRDKSSVIHYCQMVDCIQKWPTMFRRDLDILVALSWRILRLQFFQTSAKRHERRFMIDLEVPRLTHKILRNERKEKNQNSH